MIVFETIAGALKRLLRPIGAAVLAALLVGGPALADGRGHDRDGDGGRGRDGYSRGEDGRWMRGRGWRGPERGYEPYGYGYGPPRGYGGPYRSGPAYPQRPIPPGMALRRGGMIPRGYGGEVVPDYGRYRLRPPPPGFAWVRVGDRYMLVSRATGQIFDIIGE